MGQLIIQIVNNIIIKLINKFENKNIVGAGFIINLTDLKGSEKLTNKGIKIHSLLKFTEDE